jgi:hypothetical protein
MTLGALIMLGSSVAVADERGVNHAAWDVLLRRYVDAHGAVHYRAWRDEGRDALEGYLQHLAQVDVSRLDKGETLAFWINAYNANVVKGVLDHYPVASVKEVKGFFDRIRYRVAGRELTLNEIEGEGRAFSDWRIHFAVVCASSSCPSLRAEAYVADRLETQLAEQTRQFLNDPQRGLRIEDGTLWASKIFDWYKTDFIPAGELAWLRRLTPEKLLPRIEPYLDRDLAQATRSKQRSISFLDYDWSLNAQRQ